MIVVIADDFTGAAELAGISRRYGLNTTICLDEVIDTDSDVLIVCTDSRSLNKAQAVKVTSEIVEAIQKMQPEFIFKKIDSVLRGHVLDELKIQMQLTGFEKALILPANPSLGRIIRNGHYFIEGIRINETVFATDPEFPVKSSLLKEILGDSGISVLKYTDQLPVAGIVVAEVESLADITGWTKAIDNSWMMAGSADIYTTLLNKRFVQQEQYDVALTFPFLYVCGTADEKRKEDIRNFSSTLNCVAFITEQVIEKKHTNEYEWVQKAVDILKQHNKAIVAFDTNISAAVSAKLLRTAMAKGVKQLLEGESVNELFIEGGSTAAAILRELKIKMLSPVNELLPGVVRMKTGNMFVTVKPGSYAIPKQITDLYKGN